MLLLLDEKQDDGSYREIDERLEPSVIPAVEGLRTPLRSTKYTHGSPYISPLVQLLLRVLFVRVYTPQQW